MVSQPCTVFLKSSKQCTFFSTLNFYVRKRPVENMMKLGVDITNICSLLLQMVSILQHKCTFHARGQFPMEFEIGFGRNQTF